MLAPGPPVVLEPIEVSAPGPPAVQEPTAVSAPGLHVVPIESARGPIAALIAVRAQGPTAASSVSMGSAQNAVPVSAPVG